jgi:hypothetical protein
MTFKIQRLKKFFSRLIFSQTKKYKGHVVITGSGRAGTTYLVHLLTALGLYTGFTLKEIDELIDMNSKAGLERDVRDESAPFICKSPWFSEYAVDVFESIKINHIIVPIRDFNDAAQSRIRVEKNHHRIFGYKKNATIDGGLVFTDKCKNQLFHLQEQFIRLIRIVADYHVPVTFISFPRFANDPEYLYKKLNFLCRKIKYKKFLRIYSQITHPEYIHQFNHEQ